MEALQVNTAALNPEILELPKLGIRVEKKPPTVPVPFKPTEIVPKKSVVPPVFTLMAKSVPKAILDAFKNACKKKDLHVGFGIPTTPWWKYTAEIKPFSFDSRHQLFLNKKKPLR
jgi:hypothetical protein